MADREGIEIDYCPSCRGVWLDRGELDKIIERADGNDDDDRGRRDRYDDERDYRESYGHEGGGGHGGKKRRRKSMLGEMFDFG